LYDDIAKILTLRDAILMKTPELEQLESDPQQLLLFALETRWENYRAELKNCRSEFTEDAVHDLRVATRRILALIQLLNSITPRTSLKKMARAFKKQLDEFDDLRDTQVILGELSGILQELPQLEEFEQHLRSHEEQMFDDLHKKLQQRDTSGIAGWIRKTRDALEEETSDDLEAQILDAVDDAFLVVRQRLGWVDLSRSATIHRVRVVFKAFRYMVETVYPLARNFPPAVLKQMNDYQTLMGNIQDVEVFSRTLADFTENTSLMDMEAIQRYYEKRRLEAISAFVHEMDQLHTFWRPAPDQPFPWQ
jgi:CHAD domain-containing protein